jgi:hypothetical protein
MRLKRQKLPIGVFFVFSVFIFPGYVLIFSCQECK